MNNHLRFRCWPVIVLALVAASCSSGGGGGDDKPSFATFVKKQIQETAETTEPVEITGKKFAFPKQESAFNDILPAP